jgi:lysophospholipase L1-like esterase
MKTRKIVLAIALCVGVMIFLGTCTTTRSPLPEVAVETWDYVILGSSTGTYWAEYYGALVESDLGVKLIYHNYFVSGQRLWELLRDIRIDETLRGDIKKAELITLGVGAGDMCYYIAEYIAGGLNDQNRVGEELDKFRETYDTILTELLSVTSTADTIIRTMDFYYPPYIRRDQEKGTYNQTMRYWQEFNRCIIEVARKHGIPVAKVFQTFHGPDGNDDPTEKNYIHKDGDHPSEEGMKVIAEEFRKLGYGYASP